MALFYNNFVKITANRINHWRNFILIHKIRVENGKKYRVIEKLSTNKFQTSPKCPKLSAINRNLFFLNSSKIQ
jgi:hypothetical protein